MSGSVSLFSRVGAGMLLVATLLASGAWAQQPQPVRIRGSIESVDGALLTVKTRDGDERKVHLSDNVAVTGITRTTLADIKPGSYIGVTGQPQPDGTQKAIAIHIFPEAMRGTGEGFRPWDLRPNSTMTNATVDQKVEATDGQTLTVKYKDGEKKVTVTPETPIVTFVPGNKAELKAGAKIIIIGATKKEDGTYDTARVNVGLDGLTPPM
jgi:outer membrane lipoprotein SlyB